ncbi:MAG: DUF3783 domain-containing protein [Eubacteriales bacterium]|nr:DUF3783 domain-containing protein [Eubacteriales bacterium]
MKPPVLLCYNLSETQSRKIRLLAMKLMVRIRVVNPEEFGETLAALCGMEPVAQAPAPEDRFTDQMLVLGHFTHDLLNRFLYGFRQTGIPQVALKAMLTDTNMHWNSATLHSQLAEEHAAMTNGEPPVHPSEGS